MSRPRVLLAEDHPQIRTMVQNLLRAEFEVIAIVERGDEIVSTAEQVGPDVFVLDVSLPGQSGLQVLPRLRADWPQAAIVVLITHNDPLYREEAFRRGADTYLLKREAGTELVSTIQNILATPRFRFQRVGTRKAER